MKKLIAVDTVQKTMEGAPVFIVRHPASVVALPRRIVERLEGDSKEDDTGATNSGSVCTECVEQRVQQCRGEMKEGSVVNGEGVS